MTLVTDSRDLLRELEDLDCCTLEQLQQVIREKRYQLIDFDNHIR